MLHLSDNIKKFRELKGISQQKVADEIGEKRSTYAEWERGIEPKASALVKIAKVLGVSTSQLLDGIDDKPAKEAHTEHQTSPGYVPAQDLIEVLKQQNEFLRRNFETSLITILVGQKQIGAQIKGLTWYHASAVNKGDQDGIEKDLLETNNMIAAYQGAGVEGDNSETGNTKSIGGKRQSKR